MPDSVIARAHLLRRRGQPDQALLLLEKHLEAKPGDKDARLLYINMQRTLARDVGAAFRIRDVMSIPLDQYRGFAHLDPGVLDSVRDATKPPTDHVPPRRFAYLADVRRADDAISRGDLEEARRLLLTCPPDAYPVPWHYLRARLALASDDSPVAARRALVDCAVAIALMPKCGMLFRIANDACRRLGNHEAASRVLEESLRRHDRGWLDCTTRSLMPIPLLRLAVWVALLGRPSGTRFLVCTVLVRLGLGASRRSGRNFARVGRALLAPVLRGRKALAYAAYLLLVVAIGTEIFLQLLVPRSDRYYIFPPGISYLHQANPEFTPGVFTDARFKASSLGIRADEFPGGVDESVLVLGGSAGLDQLLDQDKAWPAVLQRKLNTSGVKTWVGNLSRSSRASLHNIAYFEHIVPYMPRATLLLDLVGVNDFQLALRSSFGTYTPEQELSFNFSVLPDTEFHTNFGTYRFYRKMKDWWDRRKYAFISNTVGVKFWRECRQSVAEENMIQSLPDLSAGLAETRRNLNELADRAQRYAAPIVFVTQPTLWHTDLGETERKMLLAGGVGSNGEWCKKKLYYSVAALAQGMEMFNNVTREVCRERGLFCIDLARLLPREARYYYDDMHYNEAGAERVAAILAEELIRRRRQ